MLARTLVVFFVAFTAVGLAGCSPVESTSGEGTDSFLERTEAAVADGELVRCLIALAGVAEWTEERRRTDVLWLDLDSGTFGEGESDGVGRIALPCAEYLVLAVEDEGHSHNGGWHYALVDTAVHSRFSPGLMLIELPVVLDARVPTGAGSSELVVATQSERLDRCALIGGDDFALLRKAFLDVDRGRDSAPSLAPRLVGALRDLASDVESWSVRPLLRRERARPRFRPHDEVVVPHVRSPGERSYVRLIGSIEHEHAGIGDRATMVHDWRLFYRDLMVRWSLSNVVSIDGDGEARSVLAAWEPRDAQRRVVVELPAEARSSRTGWSLASYAEIQVGDRTDHGLVDHAGSRARAGRAMGVSGAVIELDAGDAADGYLLASWNEADVRRHVFVGYEPDGARTNVPADRFVDAVASGTALEVFVDPSCFTNLERRFRPVHDVLFRLTVRSAGRVQRFSLNAPGPGRQIVSGLPSGARVSVHDARARVTSHVRAPLLDLRAEPDGFDEPVTLQCGRTERVRIVPDPTDLADHPKVRISFVFPAGSDPSATGSEVRLDIERVRRGSSSRGNAHGRRLEWIDARTAWIELDRGGWGRMSLWLEGAGGASLVGHVHASEVTSGEVRVDMRPTRTVRFEVESDGARSFDELFVWGPWDLDAIRALAESASVGAAPDRRVERDASGVFEVDGLVPGATYVLDSRDDARGTERLTFAFTVPEGLIDEVADLGTMTLSPNR